MKQHTTVSLHIDDVFSAVRHWGAAASSVAGFIALRALLAIASLPLAATFSPHAHQSDNEALALMIYS